MRKLEKNLFKHYIGYLEERDEYQQGVIYKTLACVDMYSFYLISFFMLISLIFDSINHKLTFGTFALFFIQQFNAYYIARKLKKSGVDKTEFDDKVTYSLKLKRLRKQAITTGLQWGLGMLVTMEYLFPTLEGEIIDVRLFSVIIWMCGGIFFGWGMYISGKSKLTKVDNN